MGECYIGKSYVPVMMVVRNVHREHFSQSPVKALCKAVSLRMVCGSQLVLGRAGVKDVIKHP